MADIMRKNVGKKEIIFFESHPDLEKGRGKVFSGASTI